jgi:hypothetical protein
VPLDWALHEAPPSVERSTVPVLPTAISVVPSGEAIALKRGAPLMTESDQLPPLSVLRHTSPLSPTTTIVNPWAMTPCSGWSPSVKLVQLAPPSKER